MIYLDYASATPVCKKAISAMKPFLADEFYNPSSSYRMACQVREKFEEARHKIAKIIGANQNEIIITAVGAITSIINAAISDCALVMTFMVLCQSIIFSI